MAKAEKKVARARKRLRLLTPLSPKPNGPKRRFLEVGASIGTAAEAARRKGFEAHAVEIDPDAVAKGQELYPEICFHKGMLQDVPVTEPFEMIYGAEVIEHVPDPEGFLTLCRERLAPKGVLYLTTPDAGHFRRPKALLDWHSVKPPEHIHLFTKAGMGALLKRTGFGRHFLPFHTKPGMRVIALRD
nr:class I SAM-dependent methyltransferase [Parvularcula maris]